MNSNPENRAKTRFEHMTAVTLETKKIGIQRSARMYNYSTGGMYFETDYAPLPGTEIYIGIKNSPYDAGADVYRAEIRWRKQLKPPLSNHQFGVGVRYYQPFTP